MFLTRKPKHLFFYLGIAIGLLLAIYTAFHFGLIPSSISQPATSQVLAPANLTPLDQLTLEQKAHLTDAQWQAYLPKLAYQVMRQQGTEIPFTGDLLNNHEQGTYVTADCGVPVFRSEQKYDSHTGWPSFWAPIKDAPIELRTDTSDGATRTEVVEKTCGTHLGHVFDDGPEPTGLRYCMNSVALKFVPDPQP